MNEKTVAELIRSDIKVNIFDEDEKEKMYNNAKMEEKQAESKNVVECQVIQIDDRINLDGDRRNEDREEKGKKHKAPGFDRSGWLGYTSYAPGGGGGGEYDQVPLNYDPQSRNYFVKFVFMIVFVMLLLTILFVSIVLATPDIKEVFQANHLMFLILSLGMILTMNYMMFCSECSRHQPCNFICLFFAVIGMSIVVATITCRIRTNLVFYAFIATAAVVGVCILIACTSFDFTKWYLYVVVISLAFAAVATIISVTMLIMNIHYKPIHIALLLFGTVLNCVILIMELQTILGGRAVEIGESDYALAAFMLYTSIVDIFIKLVQTMGLFDD